MHAFMKCYHKHKKSPLPIMGKEREMQGFWFGAFGPVMGLLVLLEIVVQGLIVIDVMGQWHPWKET